MEVNLARRPPPCNANGRRAPFISRGSCHDIRNPGASPRRRLARLGVALQHLRGDGFHPRAIPESAGRQRRATNLHHRLLLFVRPGVGRGRVLHRGVSTAGLYRPVGVREYQCQNLPADMQGVTTEY